MEDYYSIREVSYITGLHYNTIYHYVITGVIDAKLKNNKFWMVPASEISRINDGRIDVNNKWSLSVKNDIKNIRDRTRKKINEGDDVKLANADSNNN